MGWIFFIVTWIACFVFSYKVFYLISKADGRFNDAEDRYWRFIFSTLHILSVVFSIWCFVEEGGCKFQIKEDGWLGKILGRLEK